MWLGSGAATAVVQAVAAALIQALGQELSYATGVAVEQKKKKYGLGAKEFFQKYWMNRKK